MPSSATDTHRLRLRGLRLACFIVAWDIVEGVVAVTAGLDADSIALIGFGIDSAIEVFAASVVIWQLRAGAHDRQRPALRLLAVTFFILAAYVTIEAARNLLTADKAGEAPLGIALNVSALAVMVPVAIAQGRTGHDLDNDVLVAQAMETWLSNYLSIALLIGLGLNAAVGWWWADPIAAIGVSLLAASSGLHAWRDSRAST